MVQWKYKGNLFKNMFKFGFNPQANLEIATPIPRVLTRRGSYSGLHIIIDLLKSKHDQIAKKYLREQLSSKNERYDRLTMLSTDSGQGKKSLVRYVTMPFKTLDLLTIQIP